MFRYLEVNFKIYLNLRNDLNFFFKFQICDVLQNHSQEDLAIFWV
jgi:hypothetical protein